MPRGGKRDGAGRKKGSHDKVTRLRASMIAKAVHANGTPLDYLLEIMRDEAETFENRFAAAVEALPYVHPKLAPMHHSGDPDKAPETVTRIELVAPAAAIMRSLNG